MSVRRLSVAGLLAAALLAGCSGQPEEAAPAPTTAAGDNDTHAELPAAGASPTWDRETAHEAAFTAADAVAAFTTEDLNDVDWWNQLSRMLSPQAQLDYAGTSPEESPEGVPGTRVTGEPSAVAGGSPYLAQAVVPTDAGRYRVLLSRLDAGSPWLVERFVLPEDGAGG